ncbi:MAG TPA: hypothetical protein DCZ13_12580, partial [Porticoccaceae bacterium]|nr:hypothetical protein [Porticoccaceae bacterium]
MTYQVPKQEEVKSILDLLFNQIEISGLPAEFDPAGIDWIYGVFIDDTDTPVAIIECERKLGIFLGAAMTMVPPAAAQESVDSGDL